MPYCPRCGTALSSHEVAQGYKDVEEKSDIRQIQSEGEADTYFLAWTTTPWTLPSNVALCVNPAEDYAEIKVGDERYIMADALIGSLFKEDEYEKLSVKKGKEYEYTEYEPLFDYETGAKEKAYYVTCDGYVTLTDGTGVVHIAPAFGEDDSNVGKHYGLPFVQMVDGRGRFVDAAYDLKGVFAKDADKLIIERLKEEGQALQGADVHAQLSLLLALRHSLALLREKLVVHQSDGGQGAAARVQRLRQLDAPDHRHGQDGQLPRKRHRLGHLPRKILGHSAAHLGVQQVRQDPRRRLS